MRYFCSDLCFRLIVDSPQWASHGGDSTVLKEYMPRSLYATGDKCSMWSLQEDKISNLLFDVLTVLSEVTILILHLCFRSKKLISTKNHILQTGDSPWCLQFTVRTKRPKIDWKRVPFIKGLLSSTESQQLHMDKKENWQNSRIQSRSHQAPGQWLH